MADGKVVIDVMLDKQHAQSDIKVINSLLKAMGAGTGQTMDKDFSSNADKMKNSAQSNVNKVVHTIESGQVKAKEAMKPIDLVVYAKDNATGTINKIKSEGKSIPKDKKINLGADDKASEKINKVKKESKEIPKDEKTVLQAKDEATSTLNRVRDAMRQTTNQAHTFRDVMAGTFVGQAVSNAFSNIKNGIMGMVQAGIQYNAVQDQMTATWTTLAGSAAKGKMMVDMVNQFQRSTGYATDMLNEMEQKIYHINSDAGQTRVMTHAFTTLGDAMGLTNDRLLGVAEQFSQMMSTGKAYTGDLNIMTNAFPAFGENIQKVTGKSMAQIRQLASTGKLSSNVVQQTLIEMANKYKDATANAMGTTQGLWRSIQSNWGRLAGMFVKPIFDMKKSGFKDLEDFLSSKQADQMFYDAGKAVAGFVGHITDMIQYMAAHRDTVLAFAKVFGVLAASILAMKKTSQVMDTISTLMGGLGRLRGSMQSTAAASTAMSNASNTSMSQMNKSGASVNVMSGRMKALHGAAALASMGLTLFGGKWGWVGGILANFAPDILNVGKNVLSMGTRMLTASRGAQVLGTGLRSTGLAAAFLSNPVGWIVTGVAALATAFYYAYKNIKPFHDWVNKTADSLKNNFVDGLKKVENFFKPSLKATEDWGKGISKATSTALNSYMKLSDKASSGLEKLMATGKKVSKTNVKSLVKPYQDMANQIISNYNNMNKKASSALSSLAKTHKNEAANILKETTKNTNSEKTQVQKIADKIKGILQNAAKNHRSITSSEQKQINKLHDQMNSYAAKSVSNSAKQQQIILGKLRDNATKISTLEAAAIIRNANKQEKETISSANNTYHQAVKSATNKYNQVKRWADEEYYANHNISRSQYNDIVNAAKKTENDSINSARRQKDGVVKHATSMRDATVKAAKDQARGHKDQVDWETGKVLSGYDKFTDRFAHIINGITGFFNNIFHSIGLPNWHIPSWHPAGYASGTEGTRKDELAMVGEQGFELAHSPGKGAYIVGRNKPEVRFLPKGTSILPHEKSLQLLNALGIHGYAGGIGNFFSNLWNEVKSGVSSAIDVISDPAKMVNWISEKVGLSNFQHQWEQWKAIYGFATQLPKDLFKEIKKKIGSSMLGNPGGSGVQRWRPYVVRALAMNGLSVSAGMVNKVLRQIATESGGNPNAVQHGYTDINTIMGDLAKGLMQTTSSTFNAFKFPGHNNIFNGLDDLLAAINYAKHRYGPGLSYLGLGHGYEKGTDYSDSGTVAIAEKEPEFVKTPDGRVILITHPTIFDDFMAGSKVTPVSKLPHFAQGTIDAAQSVVSGVSSPEVNIIPSSGYATSGESSQNSKLQVIITPQTVSVNMDGKAIWQEVKKWDKKDVRMSQIIRGKIGAMSS